jgi:dihydrofolate reductase
MACSLDGFIAGPNDDLEWLHEDHTAPGDLAADPKALQFDEFMGQVGALLMGRTTFDVVEAMNVWSYGETPLLVATRRPLASARASVTPVSGNIRELVDQAKTTAGDKDVYLDGGDLIRQALDANLVDEITATWVPILLTRGTRLFDGLVSRRKLQFVSHRFFGSGMLQVTARVQKS